MLLEYFDPANIIFLLKEKKIGVKLPDVSPGTKTLDKALYESGRSL